MNRLIVFALTTLTMGFGVALAEERPPITVKGEILDMACYIDHGSKGAKHAQCAKRCVESGQPMGLLAADGTVYLLSADHKDATAFNNLKKLAGGQAAVTGELSEKAGVKMLEVQAGKPAK